MFQAFFKAKKKKTSSMSEDAATPTINQQLSTEESHASAVPSAEQTALFMEIYDYAKNNYNWQKVAAVISNYPQWLTRIPQGRRWTILHQIVFFGNVNRLNEILGYQSSNEDFRFLCKTLDDKTVREVATERAHVNPQMLRRIERLVAIDQILHNARDNKWELVKQSLRHQPDIANEKPPFRKFYLAHYLASTGQLDIFIDLCAICHFKLDLVAENKKINEIARENNHIAFAEYIEQRQTLSTETHTPAVTGAESTTVAANELDLTSVPTTVHSFSHGFFDDPGIMILSLVPGPIGSMFSTHDDPFVYSSQQNNWSSHSNHTSTNGFHEQNSTASSMTTTNGYNSQENKQKQKANVNKPAALTEAEQLNYEKAVLENIKQLSAEHLLNAITCCITKSILKDPVVAADGFTYEREAILHWFAQSDRSPMTNQKLENQDLKPNHAIKSILQTLSESKSVEKNTDEKLKKTGKNAH